MTERPAPPRLGALEQKVMAVLWSASTALSARQVLERLDQKRLAYTTVATVLGHLVDKSLVVRVPGSGRSWLYQACVGNGEYSGAVMRSALAGSSDRTASILHFVDGMSEVDRQLLREILDAGAADHDATGVPGDA